MFPRVPFPHNLRRIFKSYFMRKADFLSKNIEFLGVSDGVLVNSAREGLYLILEKNNDKKDSEIILPVFTCNVLIGAILKSNFKPVFADINRETLNMEFDNIIPLINENTKVILITHQFGYPTEMNKIIEFCKEKEILVIEDAAQAFGATYNNDYVGNQGDLGFFSFENSKVISSIQGGLIIGKKKYLEKIKDCKVKQINKNKSFIFFIKAITQFFLFNELIYGFILKYWILIKGRFSAADELNLEVERYSLIYSPMSKFQQNLGFNQLLKINEILTVRRESALLYIEMLKNCDKILSIPQQNLENKQHTYSRFSILVENKNEVYKTVKKHGVDLGFTFSYKLSQYFNKDRYENADYIISKILCIPMTNNLDKNKEIILRVRKALDTM